MNRQEGELGGSPGFLFQFPPDIAGSLHYWSYSLTLECLGGHQMQCGVQGLNARVYICTRHTHCSSPPDAARDQRYPRDMVRATVS